MALTSDLIPDEVLRAPPLVEIDGDMGDETTVVVLPGGRGVSASAFVASLCRQLVSVNEAARDLIVAVERHFDAVKRFGNGDPRHVRNVAERLRACIPEPAERGPGEETKTCPICTLEIGLCTCEEDDS
jgi:hypothetical protein